MELAGIKPPELDWNSTNLTEAWEKFQRHVKLIHDGPFKDKTDPEKISYLLLWIGDRGRDVHATWILTNDEKKDLDLHYRKFKEHVQPKLNPIFSRYKFNNEVQGSDSIDAFVTRLRLAARDCSFSVHEQDNLIRDRIVLGTRTSKVREQLINIGRELTLEKAIQTAQSYEYSQEQLKTMGKDVDFCRAKTTTTTKQRRQPSHGQTSMARDRAKPKGQYNMCTNCGRSHTRKVPSIWTEMPQL